jgi:hypothetical protein
MNAETLLLEVQQRGVKLSLTGERLHVDAPAGTLSPELIERLKAAKPDLIHLLLTAKGVLCCPSTNQAITGDAAELFEERAAIAEYDAGLSREDAETQAREAIERHKQECWNRHQKVANYILSLPTWPAREKALERYRQAAMATYGETTGNIIGREMAGWVRFRSGLTPGRWGD